jgi:hypothetical protein
MAVVKVSETPGKRSGNTNNRYEGTYKRVFSVVLSSSRYGPIAAAAAVTSAYDLAIGTAYSIGVAPDPTATPPVVGDAWHEADPGSRVVSITADEDGQADGCGWTVTVDYGPGEASDNPLDEPPQLDWQFTAYERPVDQDTSGNPIVNTAGDPFDPPPMRDDSRPVLVITRNELTFNPATSWEYRDTLNNAAFYGAPTGTVKLKSRVGTQVQSRLVAGGSYWRVTYTFEFNADGWAKTILNAGYRQLASGALTQVFINNQPATSPVLLNAAGALTITPYFRTFAVYASKNFGTFAFPGA